MRIVELKRIKQFATPQDIEGRPTSRDKTLYIGDTVIQVDVDELLAKLGDKTSDEKRKMLKEMGYQEYLDILRKEEGFGWL